MGKSAYCYILRHMVSGRSELVAPGSCKGFILNVTMITKDCRQPATVFPSSHRPSRNFYPPTEVPVGEDAGSFFFYGCDIEETPPGRPWRWGNGSASSREQLPRCSRPIAFRLDRWTKCRVLGAGIPTVSRGPIACLNRLDGSLADRGTLKEARARFQKKSPPGLGLRQPGGKMPSFEQC